MGKRRIGRLDSFHFSFHERRVGGGLPDTPSGSSYIDVMSTDGIIYYVIPCVPLVDFFGDDDLVTFLAMCENGNSKGW